MYGSMPGDDFLAECPGGNDQSCSGEMSGVLICHEGTYCGNVHGALSGVGVRIPIQDY